MIKNKFDGFPLYYNGISKIKNDELVVIRYYKNVNNNKKIKVNIKSYILILSIFFSINSFGQYSSYMENIREAELFLLKNDKEKAIEYYDRAFELSKKPFPKDIHNQMLTLIQCKKKEIVKAKLIFLMNNYLIHPRYFKKYLKFGIKKNYKNYKKNYNSNLNTIEIRLLDSLCFLDQKIRTSDNYINGVNKIKAVDSITFKIFQERILPQFENDKLNVSFFFRRVHFEPDNNYYVLIRHWFQQKFKNVDSTIHRLVLGLDFPPEVYADLIDVKVGQLEKSCYGMFTEIKYGKEIKKIKRSDSDIEFINLNRKEIILQDYYTYIKLIEYKKQNPKYLFYNLNTLIFTGNKFFKEYFDKM